MYNKNNLRIKVLRNWSTKIYNICKIIDLGAFTIYIFIQVVPTPTVFRNYKIFRDKIYK